MLGGQIMPDKDVEDMEKFMSVLMEVKVSLAEQNGKLDNLLDMKEQINQTSEIATNAGFRSKQNAESIEKLQTKVATKASKDDIERVVKQRENTFKNLPAWIALVISMAGFLLTYIAN